MTTPARGRCLIELFALCGFAITQPVLETFGPSPDWFLFRGAAAVEVVAFATTVAVLPALVLWVLELAVRAVRADLHLPVHLGLLGLLLVLVVVQALRNQSTGPVVWIVGGLIALVALTGYRWFAPLRLWVAYLAAAPVGFVLLFLLTSPTSGLLASDPPVREVRVGSPAPVVLIVLDELPLSALIDGRGQIDRELYPHLAALADDAHWYRNATSVAPGTYHAVPAVLTGRMANDGQGPGAVDHPESLFTLLGGSYEVHAEELITRLCPEPTCPRPASSAVLGDLLDDAADAMRARLGLDTWRDPVAQLAAFTSPVAELDRFIDGIGSERQSLHFAHLLLPHRPFRFLPDGRTYAEPIEEDLGIDPDGSRWSDHPWPGTLGKQRLVLQMQFVDQMLGDAVDRLRDLGIYDDSLIVVTADHGMSFDPSTYARPLYGEPLDETSTTDLLWVPLIVKEPGQTAGLVDDRNALTIDIVPTIADVLDVDVPWDVDGRSLLGPPRSTSDKPWRPTEVGSRTIDVGEQVTIDGEAGFRDLFTRSLDELLPPGRGKDRIWRVGPHSELVGQRVEEVSDQLASVEADAMQADDAGAGEVPALVWARGGDLGVGDEVAVAVDGRVAATAPVVGHRGRPVLAAMVDPDLVDGGHAEVVLYRISA